MRRKLVSVLALTAVIMLCTGLAACGGPKVPERLIGEWDCAAKASDEMTDTGFYALTIESDGTFSLAGKSGEPGISGTMKGDDTGKLGILELNCDEENFNPPECWARLQKNSRLRYKIISEDTIRLGYVGIWLTFTK